MENSFVESNMSDGAMTALKMHMLIRFLVNALHFSPTVEYHHLLRVTVKKI